LIKYRECQIRALGLIKSFLIDTFKATMNEIKSKTTGRKLADTGENVREVLLYAKFKAVATKVRSLIYQLEKGALRDKSQYNLLKDCLSYYFWMRKGFLVPWIRMELGQYIKTGDLVVTVSRTQREHDKTMVVVYFRSDLDTQWSFLSDKIV
jgi:hypothetical protein